MAGGLWPGRLVRPQPLGAQRSQLGKWSQPFKLILELMRHHSLFTVVKWTNLGPGGRDTPGCEYWVEGMLGLILEAGYHTTLPYTEY